MDIVTLFEFFFLSEMSLVINLATFKKKFLRSVRRSFVKN